SNKFLIMPQTTTISSQQGCSAAAGEGLVNALTYLKEYAIFRLGEHFKKEVSPCGHLSLPEETDNTPFSRFVRHYRPSEYEMIMLLTVLAPHLIPGFFDSLIQEFLPQGGEFPEFGGVKGTFHRGTLPTGE